MNPKLNSKTQQRQKEEEKLVGLPLVVECGRQ